MSARELRFGALALACALDLLAGSTSARAAEDGGVRSVFASGSGNRALAMGSAFVGIADDASAIVWNPGGLGALQWMEVQAAHSAYADLGSREDYLALVRPDWRWGTVGLSIRHFGVGGVDGRDDRNLPTAGDLSSSESEVTVGYGRSLSPAVSVGAAVKLQRQTVAGVSGSGLGADLGVLARPSSLFRSDAPWLGRVTWGFSVRNAVRPSIRLDRESVRDPAVLRTGLAYAHPILAGQRALFAIDLEKSPGVGARVHTGIEVRVHPLLGLRAGFNQGSLSAGTAFSWRGLVIDYAYQDEDLAGVHHVGISRALGRSVVERREAATRVREEAIQARLEEGFQARQLEQLDELLAQAKSAEDRGDLDAALDLLSTVAILYPGDRRLTDHQVRCLYAKGARLEAAMDFAGAALAYGRAVALAPGDTAAAAGQLRCRTESDRRAARSQSIRRRFAEASDAFAADSLDLARKGFASILAIDSTDADAVQMLRRTEQAIAQRAVALERARMADRAKAPPRAALGAGKKRVSPLPRHQLEALYQAGLRATSEKRPEDARRYWEIVWSADPDYKQVREFLKREYLMRGMELLAAGKLEDAVGFWEKVLEIDPEDRRAAVYIMRARTQQTRVREIVGTDR